MHNERLCRAHVFADKKDIEICAVGDLAATEFAKRDDGQCVGFVEEARAKIAAAVPLPTGYQLSFGGQFENQQRASARLSLVIPLALALIFVLLFSTFGSVRQALLVLSNIPFALVGGIVALWVAREYLSVPASVGFIALLGIAVLNGIVLVSYFNQLHAEGLPLLECVKQGAARRLRPLVRPAPPRRRPGAGDL